MKYDLEIENKLNFDMKEMTSPECIFEEMGEELETFTKGFVKGCVDEYGGYIESYNQISAFDSIAAALGTATIYKDVQDKLGATGKEKFRYEFYLMAPSFENYKFRLLFFEFGIGNYPVKIVLEQGIADEVFGEENAVYIFEKNTKSELVNVIKNVLSSKRVIKIMQDLIVASQKSAILLEKQQHCIEKTNEDQ